MPFYSVPFPPDPAKAEQNGKAKEKKKDILHAPTDESTKELPDPNEPTEPGESVEPAAATSQVDKKENDVEMVSMDGSVTDGEVKQETEKALEEGELPVEEEPKPVQQESRVEKYIREEKEKAEKINRERRRVFEELIVGTNVYVLEGHYGVVDPRAIYTPGCDASAANDQELPLEVKI
jgi:hypothetical protein